MSGRRLDASYASFQLQIGAHVHAREAATRATVRTEFLSSLGLAGLIGEVVKDRRKRILEHFEQTGRQIRRQAFMDLVASFEADLFRSIGMASSKARHLLNRNFQPNDPFFTDRDDLVRTVDDFSNLGGYKRLLARRSHSASDPRRELWEVIAYRDFLAHGERWECPANPPTVEIAYAVMSREIDRIEAKR